MVIFNKKVNYEYTIKDKLEAGIILTGAEVKSVRNGNVSLSESFLRLKNESAYLINAYIGPYQKKSETYDPKRERKVLLHKAEIEHLRGKLASGGLTLVPLKMYTIRNLVKLEIALAMGKKKYEKREALKQKAIERDTEQSLKETQKSKLKAQNHS